jgi:hypothetical protein
MFHHRQELHVGEAHASDVLRQVGGELPVAERAVALFGHAPPGAEVHLVDRDGTGESVPPMPLAHPRVVAPLVVELPDDGGSGGGRLAVERERIGLVDAMATMA